MNIKPPKITYKFTATEEGGKVFRREDPEDTAWIGDIVEGFVEVPLRIVIPMVYARGDMDEFQRRITLAVDKMVEELNEIN
ncbi:hypothetical protein LCGC14_0549220 [marine sediment metagenome]|uniref:Uncharacterized protein n=1 Tax=marine sediment metagenome TaxID=412755 RepID=A0A0F9UYP2_9ZZZZ